MSLSIQSRMRVGVAYAIAISLAIWLVFPPLWMVLTSLKPGREVFAIPPVWFFTPTLQHYSSILSRPDLLTIVYNTVIVSLLTSIITLLFGTMAAYSMSRFRTGGAPLLFGTLVIRILPPIVLGLPFFVLFSQ